MRDRTISASTLLGIALLCAAAAIALGNVHPFGDPHSRSNTISADERGKLLHDVSLPAAAKATLVTKCADCHSDATHWPAYARIAPGSWLIERDVIRGREKMNLSHWDELTPDRRQVLAAKILQETRQGNMPPIQYLALHWNAKLTPVDLEALSSLSKEGGTTEASTNSSGDTEHGKIVFERRCTGCHTIDTDREGPHLRGIFGRKAGTIPGFRYSAELKTSGITWDADSLDKWLSDTDAMIPNNQMGFRVPKATERADLIAYLKEMK